MKLSKHFSREEFKCSCNCGQDTIDYELLMVLEDIREYFDRPVIITSGNRCVKHNQTVGGAKNSQHVKSRAADFKVKGVAVSAVYDYLVTKYPNQYGIGLYSSWVHLDTRGLLARWNKS